MARRRKSEDRLRSVNVDGVGANAVVILRVLLARGHEKRTASQVAAETGIVVFRVRESFKALASRGVVDLDEQGRASAGAVAAFALREIEHSSPAVAKLDGVSRPAYAGNRTNRP